MKPSLLTSFLVSAILSSALLLSHALPATELQQQSRPQSIPGSEPLTPTFSLESGLLPQQKASQYYVEVTSGDHNGNDDTDGIPDLGETLDSDQRDRSLELDIPYNSLESLIPELLREDPNVLGSTEISDKDAAYLEHLDTDKRAREFIGKRAREFIGKRAREFIGKRAREFIGKRAREFIGKRAREFIGKRAREFIGKRAREFIGKRAREFIGKRAREFIGKRNNAAILGGIQDNLIRNAIYAEMAGTGISDDKRAREFIGKRAREFIGKRAREFIGKRAREFIGKRAREFIGKRAREFIGKRAREFIGKRAREFIGKRAREFIGKREPEYKFDDGYFSGSEQSEDDDASGQQYPYSLLGLDAGGDQNGDVFPVTEESKEQFLLRPPFDPDSSDHDLLYEDKRHREFIGKRSDNEMPVSKRAREFIGKRAELDSREVSKRHREFIGKREAGDGHFGDFVRDSSLSPSLGIK